MAALVDACTMKGGDLMTDKDKEKILRPEDVDVEEDPVSEEDLSDDYRDKIFDGEKFITAS